MTKLPVTHTGLEDCLPEDHPLAHEDIYCKRCGAMLHAFNNELMQDWTESEEGNFCLPCVVFNVVLGSQSK